MVVALCTAQPPQGSILSFVSTAAALPATRGVPELFPSSSQPSRVGPLADRRPVGPPVVGGRVWCVFLSSLPGHVWPRSVHRVTEQKLNLKVMTSAIFVAFCSLAPVRAKPLVQAAQGPCRRPFNETDKLPGAPKHVRLGSLFEVAGSAARCKTSQAPSRSLLSHSLAATKDPSARPVPAFCIKSTESCEIPDRAGGDMPDKSCACFC